MDHLESAMEIVSEKLKENEETINCHVDTLIREGARLLDQLRMEKLRAVELKRTNECLTQNRRETMKELDEVRRQLETEKDQQKLKNLKERETVLHQQACELFKKTFFTIPERLKDSRLSEWEYKNWIRENEVEIKFWNTTKVLHELFIQRYSEAPEENRDLMEVRLDKIRAEHGIAKDDLAHFFIPD